MINCIYMSDPDVVRRWLSVLESYCDQPDHGSKLNWILHKYFSVWLSNNEIANILLCSHNYSASQRRDNAVRFGSFIGISLITKHNIYTALKYSLQSSPSSAPASCWWSWCCRRHWQTCCWVFWCSRTHC